jgi:hypothetical protein
LIVKKIWRILWKNFLSKGEEETLYTNNDRSSGIPASTESIVRTLIVNSIRMVIRKKVIKERGRLSSRGSFKELQQY